MADKACRLSSAVCLCSLKATDFTIQAFLHTVRGPSSGKLVRVSLQKCTLCDLTTVHQPRCDSHIFLIASHISIDGSLAMCACQFAVKIEREPGIKTLKAELKVHFERELVSTLYLQSVPKYRRRIQHRHQDLCALNL